MSRASCSLSVLREHIRTLAASARRDDAAPFRVLVVDLLPHVVQTAAVAPAPPPPAQATPPSFLRVHFQHGSIRTTTWPRWVRLRRTSARVTYDDRLAPAGFVALAFAVLEDACFRVMGATAAPLIASNAARWSLSSEG